MKHVFTVIMGMMTLLPAAGLAQVPDGSDINKAIPVYFGQTVVDIGDKSLAPNKVYSITLAKGQQLTVLTTINNPGGAWGVQILNPSTTSLGSATSSNVVTGTGYCCYRPSSLSVPYQVAAAGTYFIQVYFYDSGMNYTMTVSAQGTPLGVANPTSAGCLTGQVDYITYSLQLIAASLPDEASIGGTKLCSTCTVKPPAYPQLVSKMETSMGLNVGISACYDATGSIFQLKMIHP